MFATTSVVCIAVGPGYSPPLAGEADPTTAASLVVAGVPSSWLVVAGVAIALFAVVPWIDRRIRRRRAAVRSLSGAERLLHLLTEDHALARGDTLYAETVGRDPPPDAAGGDTSRRVEEVVGDLRSLPSRGADEETAAAARAVAFALLALRVAVDALAHAHCGALLAARTPQAEEALEGEWRARRLVADVRAHLLQALATAHALL